MSLPINWQSVATPTVGRTNLLSTSVAPFTRLVDPSLSTDEGNAYNDLQAAWNACSDGDSIFVKAGLQSGGLTVSSGAGNVKHNITIFCESQWAHGSVTDAAYWTTKWEVQDCNGIAVYNAVVRGATGVGVGFINCDDLYLNRVVSDSSTADGFLLQQISYSTFERCLARSNTNRGWIAYDALTENSWYNCGANANGSHGFQFSQFPTTNGQSFFNRLFGCWARDNTGSGDGFNIYVGPTGGTPTYGMTNMQLYGCNSRGNAGDGFSVEFDGVEPFMMEGCNAVWNTGAGMRRTGSAALTNVVWSNNHLAGNTAGNLIGSMVGATGYDQNGLTAPGTNKL